MKILAHIPVEKVDYGHSFSFKYAEREVEVVRVLRSPATRHKHLKRWHYWADIKDHPDVHKDAFRGGADALFRVRIQRRGLNGTWKPPIFPEGRNVVEVTE